MKRLVCLLLSAALLAGCAAGPLRLMPSAPPAATAAPQASPAPARVLTVRDDAGLLAEALGRYAAAQGVQVETAAEGAALAVSAAAPAEGEALDLLASGSLLAGAAGALAGTDAPCTALELTGSRYGYLADSGRLTALLGAEFSAGDLEKATAAEWRDFIEALDRWLDAPGAAEVVLNGKTFALPDQRPEALASLEAVFTVAGEDRFSGPVLAPVLGTCYQTPEQAAAGGRTDAELVGALNSLWTLLTDEASSLAGPEGRIEPGAGDAPDRAGARDAFAEGRALFLRGSAAEAAAAGLDAESTVVVPLKFTFDESDLHGGLPLEDLVGQPVAGSGGWVYIPADADEAGRAEAAAFLLWLYADADGRKLLEGDAATGLPDLSAALSAESRAAIDAAGDDLAQLTQFTAAGRGAFTDAVLAALP